MTFWIDQKKEFLAHELRFFQIFIVTHAQIWSEVYLIQMIIYFVIFIYEKFKVATQKVFLSMVRYDWKSTCVRGFSCSQIKSRNFKKGQVNMLPKYYLLCFDSSDTRCKESFQVQIKWRRSHANFCSVPGLTEGFKSRYCFCIFVFQVC